MMFARVFIFLNSCPSLALFFLVAMYWYIPKSSANKAIVGDAMDAINWAVVKPLFDDVDVGLGTAWVVWLGSNVVLDTVDAVCAGTAAATVVTGKLT